MSLNIKNFNNIEDIVDFISHSINTKLSEDKRVLWFLSGGSSIKIETKIAERINKEHKGDLVITLSDERYGEVNHSDSNWFQLLESGFDIPKAKLVPFLTGKSFKDTTIELREKIRIELNKADYKIGIFGIGIDGHTAGILPHTEAVNSNELICAYDTHQYDRITITGKAISFLDEAIIIAIGDMKWPMIEKLEKDIPIDEQPAQILKSVPLLTIFTDYRAE